MPKQWSDKEERQYEHIKESAKDRGKSQERAKEIAARTVNKERREKGKTSKSGDSGKKNQRLEDRTKKELYDRAQDLDIDGRSKMNKQELVEAIRDRQ